MRYFLLYIPFILAWGLLLNPTAAYITAWAGSFWIFYVTLTGKVKPLPLDLSLAQQFFRPIILTQLIFAGYMAVSSIFYFMDSLGFYYLVFNDFESAGEHELQLIAEGQTYYILAHAALAHGMLLGMKYPDKPIYKVTYTSLSGLMLWLTLLFSALTFSLQFISGLTQVQLKIANLSFVASVIALAYALPEKNFKVLFIALALFTLNMYHAFTSGWKEEILVPVIILGVLIYPLYRKTATIFFPALFILFIVFIPTYNNIVRQQAWFGAASGNEAADVALAQIQSGEVDIYANNWLFLTNRASEIGMFTRYIDTTPKVHEFYGLEIAEQAVMSLIPRMLYTEKPITEELVMKRVYAAGVVSSTSKVSAKPPPVTDAYLSGGAPAVLITFLLLGIFASFVSVQAENLFGGYLLGSGLVYTGLFQILWRGNCFEFMLNAAFWSFILMYVLFIAGRQIGLITRNT